jgi:hypothetical protein
MNKKAPPIADGAEFCAASALRWLRRAISTSAESPITRNLSGTCSISGKPKTGSSTRRSEMQFRRLGDSDLEVSEISLGSWLTYSGGVGREQTEACTRAAFEAGINFFDTANVYGRGAAEEAWGEILSDYDRKSYVLATKIYFPMSETDRGLSAKQIEKQLDASLGRLQPTTSTSISATVSMSKRRSRRRWRG